jgi:CheY-like chemotaxis protein
MIAPALVHTLIVDDDREIRATLRDLLTEEGYSVAVALDGADALPILRDDPHPLVVLLDWKMPRMDGIELLRAVEADPNLGLQRAFLLVTANAQALTVELRDVLERMRVPLVPKPFDTDHLLSRIEGAARRLRLD